MMSYFATAVLASSMLFSFLAMPASEKAVTFKGSIEPEAAQADHFTVTLQLDIGEGWHTYDEVGEGSEVRTSLELKLPAGVTAKGDWSRPRGTEGMEAGYLIYEGQVSFSKNVVIEPNAYGKSIDVIVSYQACTDEYCNPPQTKTVSIAIPENVSSGSSLFDRPIRISVDGEPLNAVAKKMFLSPGIFDVDGDGTAELVIGTLLGDVGVHENLNTSGQGDPVWDTGKPLKGIEGKAIQSPNW